MKILQVSGARSVWIFPYSDLNPRGKAVERSANNAIVERYKFSVVPNAESIAEALKNNTTAFIFKGGEYQTPSGEIISVALSIHNDGLIADTRSSTLDADHFLNDFLTWLSNDFGLLPHGPLVRRKLYVSDLNIQFERPLMLVNPKLEGISDLLADKIKNRVPGLKFEVGAMALWQDPEAPVKTVPFRLERALNVPFSEGRYFSQAPIHTHEHIELLEKIEQTASA